ncbi:hypothetical protein F2Q69_00053789 [Brassica cretica]|uniref:Uncharacterized protein n=1 Tax=Brassica cretica TaxID=69181 RepID=A0A8S9N133_BRACR|nr:hypothetical protein F2Q69_00053789 [Brassica cretica]
MRSSSSVFDSGEWRFFQPRAAGFGGSPLFSVGCDTTGGEKKKVKLRKAIAGRGDGVEGLLEVGFIGKWWRIEFLRFGSGIDA